METQESNSSILNSEVSSPLGETLPSPAAVKTVEDGWLKGIDADIAGDPSLKAIQDLPSLVKSYVHAQKMIGKDRVLIPGEKASEQELKNFYSKLGLPEEGKYELGVKGEETVLGKEAIDELKKLAYANNILPKQAEALVKFMDEKIKTRNELSMAKAEEELNAKIDGLKTEWGEAFPTKLRQAQRVVSMFGDENFSKYLDETGLGNDVEFIKFVNKIGSNLLEDKFKTEAVGHLGLSKEDAQREINLIYGDMKHPYYDQHHPAHADEVARVEKLFQVVSGNA